MHIFIVSKYSELKSEMSCKKLQQPENVQILMTEHWNQENHWYLSWTLTEEVTSSSRSHSLVWMKRKLLNWDQDQACTWRTRPLPHTPAVRTYRRRSLTSSCDVTELLVKPNKYIQVRNIHWLAARSLEGGAEGKTPSGVSLVFWSCSSFSVLASRR